MGNCIITRRGLSSEASVKQEGIYPVGADSRPIGDVIVPDNVRRLYGYIFRENKNVWSVALPNLLTSIDEYGFAECSNLTSINLPDNLEEIKNYCFMNCSELRAANINVESKCTSIGKQAFYGCQALKDFTFPYGLRQIGESAFYDCQNLTKVLLPMEIDCINTQSFYNCQGVKEIRLSPKIVSIANGAFRYNYYVQRIYTQNTTDSEYTATLPQALTSIGDNAFEGCFSHISEGATMLLPQKLQSIGTYAFYHCVNLKHVDVEDGAMFDIKGRYTFAYCEMLDDESVLNITSHIKSITSSAYLFNNCIGLKNVNTQILSSYMFTSCANLESIAGTNILTDSGSYIITSCSKIKSIVLESAGTNISDNAFSGCVTLEVFKVSGTTSSMGKAVFNGDKGLKTLHLPATIVSCVLDSLTSASSSYYFLQGCTALEDVVLGDGWSVSVRLDVSDKLTHDSLLATINNLADLNSIGKDTQTLTIGAANKAKLTAEEIKIATDKGWSIV